VREEEVLLATTTASSLYDIIDIYIHWCVESNMLIFAATTIDLITKVVPYNFFIFFFLLPPFTTRKPEKSNGITDGIFPSIIYTDRNNSVSKSVGIYRRNMSVGIYRRFCRRSIQFVWKYTTAWWRQAILPTDITEEFKLR
jgi:hypothetical protein